MSSARRAALLALMLLFTAAASQPVLAQGAPPAAAPTGLLPQDLSFWGMIGNADIIVKGVIAGLALASVLTWTVAVAKAVELLLNGQVARRGMRALHGATSLAEAGARMGERGLGAQLVAAVRVELEASRGLDAEGVKERAAWRLERLVARAGRVLGRGMGVLATIGSTAPFVGLFGTVWGIMNAFIGIARSQTTNLAVVAPGIAEALLATAIGLVAAIPAVVIYNLCARAITAARAQMADAVAETMRLLSRDLDRGAADQMGVPGGHLRAAE